MEKGRRKEGEEGEGGEEGRGGREERKGGRGGRKEPGSNMLRVTTFFPMRGCFAKTAIFAA